MCGDFFFRRSRFECLMRERERKKRRRLDLVRPFSSIKIGFRRFSLFACLDLPQTHRHSLRKFRAATGASSQKRSTTRSPREVSMRTDIFLPPSSLLQAQRSKRRRRRRVKRMSATALFAKANSFSSFEKKKTQLFPFSSLSSLALPLRSHTRGRIGPRGNPLLF